MHGQSNRTITLEEQVASGMRSQRPSNFVPALALRNEQPAPVNSTINHTIDVTPSATQHIELRTSATDRAVGFMISTLPLASAFSMVVVGICVLGYNVPLMSLPTIIIVFTVFAVVWCIAYVYTLSISAEGVSMFEARERWSIIRDEHRMRWNAWLEDKNR